MSENSITQNIGIIPEFFYDLISKVPPGLLLLAMLVFEFYDFPSDYFNQLLSVGAGSSIIIFFMFLTVSYVFGSILGALGGYITKKIYTPRLFKKIILENRELVSEFVKLQSIPNIDLGKIDNFTDDQLYQLYRESHDYIKLKDNRILTLIPKISAEAALYTNLAASLIMILFIHLINRALYSEVPFFHCTIYFFGVLLIFLIIWLGKSQYKKLLRFQFSFLRYVVYKELK